MKDSLLHKRLLEHHVTGSEFEWPELTKPEKDAKKKRINARACGIIKRRVNAGFVVAVMKSVWEREMSNSPYADGYLGKTFYAAGVFACLNFVRHWANDYSRTGYFRYVFEQGADGQREAVRILEKMKTNDIDRETFHMGGYSFKRMDDPEFVPLQAADFLAYETYRQIDNRVITGIKLDRRGKEIDVRGALKCLAYWDQPKYSHPDQDPRRLPTPVYGVYLDEPKIVGIRQEMEERFPLGFDQE